MFCHIRSTGWIRLQHQRPFWIADSSIRDNVLDSGRKRRSIETCLRLDFPFDGHFHTMSLLVEYLICHLQVRFQTIVNGHLQPSEHYSYKAEEVRWYWVPRQEDVPSCASSTNHIEHFTWVWRVCGINFRHEPPQY